MASHLGVLFSALYGLMASALGINPRSSAWISQNRQGNLSRRDSLLCSGGSDLLIVEAREILPFRRGGAEGVGSVAEGHAQRQR